MQVKDAKGKEQRLILGKVTGKSAAALFLHPEAELTPEEAADFRAKLAEREAGTPLAYVLGEQDFYGRTFRITRDVLIPRPETEGLLERALNMPARNILELCTGSGILAISLALAGRSVVAADISADALAVARDNAEAHKANVTFLQSDLFDKIEGIYDLILANPPYIETEELQTLDVAGQEPLLALDGGERGMELIERILKEAPRHLTEEGVLLLEIGMDQGEYIKQAAAHYAQVTIEQDLFGRDRYVIARPGREYARKTG